MPLLLTSFLTFQDRFDLGGVYTGGLGQPTQFQRTMPPCNTSIVGGGGAPYSVPGHSAVPPLRYTPSAGGCSSSDFQPPYFPPPHCANTVPQQSSFDFQLHQYQYLDPYSHHHLNVPQYSVSSIPHHHHHQSYPPVAQSSLQDRYAPNPQSLYYNDSLKTTSTAFIGSAAAAAGSTYDDRQCNATCSDYLSLRRPDLIPSKVIQSIDGEVGHRHDNSNDSNKVNKMTHLLTCTHA